MISARVGFLTRGVLCKSTSNTRAAEIDSLTRSGGGVFPAFGQYTAPTAGFGWRSDK
jgi:hypothetical protein